MDTFASFVDYIVKKKLPCYFISPHLDDAMVSAENLITYLGKRTKVSIVSVFTEADDKPYTFAAKRFLRKTGYENAKKLFSLQRSENIKACELTKTLCIHLGFIDGLWRKKSFSGFWSKRFGNILPEMTHLYPKGKVFGEVIAKGDKKTVQDIQERLLSFIPQKNCVVFSPLGIVKHMDHMIIREVCLTSFSQVIYWQDFPYDAKQKKQNPFLKNAGMKEWLWEKNGEEVVAKPEMYYMTQD